MRGTGRILLVALIGLVALAFIQHPSVAEERSCKIGAILSTTGRYSGMGGDAKQGAVEILVEIKRECSEKEKEDLERTAQRKLYDAFFITFRINLLLQGTLTKEEGKTRRIIVEG